MKECPKCKETLMWVNKNAPITIVDGQNKASCWCPYCLTYLYIDECREEKCEK